MTSYTIPGMHVREHSVEVPLNWWDDTDPRRITVFARELVDPMRQHDELPCLLFLQGGPGGKSPRPLDPSGWIGQALKSYRVVLLDQRGTGRSTPVNGRRMDSFASAEEAAEYLACFRADSIVADAEHLRSTVFGGAKWSTLGQSYGGFITMAYLSRAPEGLTACYVTGGLPGDAGCRRGVPADVSAGRRPRTGEFYQRYPHNVERVAADRGPARGRRRTAAGRRPADGPPVPVARDRLRDEARVRADPLADRRGVRAADELSDTFLSQVMSLSSYADGPLFAALQEALLRVGPRRDRLGGRAGAGGSPGSSPRRPGRCCSPAR